VVIGLLITFFFSGLWHGAGWNFIVYGLVQGSIMAVEFLLGIKSTKLAKTYTGKFKGRIVTYLLFSFSLIFFRSSSLKQSIEVITRLFNDFHFNYAPSPKFAILSYLISVSSILALLLFERHYADKFIYKENDLKSEIIYASLGIIALIVLGVFHNLSFIYFQF
jgi:D-alanyl-lipoteichoic acid acyltransferase DltB (MBOAT superfamily)